MIRERLEERRQRRGGSRRWTGMFLLVAGGLLLIQRMGAGLPEWIFTWQVLLISLGVFFGIKDKFNGPTWLLMILVGSFFLAARFHPEWELKNYTAPLILIAIGIAFMLRPCKSNGFMNWSGRKQLNNGKDGVGNTVYESESQAGEDYLDVTSVFGGTKKNIMTKDFKGGEITNFMGGAELNLLQADISGRVVLEITQVFGGTKLIVPSHWDVRSEFVSIFAGMEDKRQLTAVDPSKVLILRGTSIFAGIDIRSY